MPRQMTINLVCKVGPYAGQVLEYPQHVGEALLATGQAEVPSLAPRREAETRPLPDLSSLTKDELVALAEERDVKVVRADGEEGAPLKSDYLRALT